MKISADAAISKGKCIIFGSSELVVFAFSEERKTARAAEAWVVLPGCVPAGLFSELVCLAE